MKTQYKIIVIALIIAFSGCKKYLEKTPNITFSIPQSLDDFQGILDAEPIVNPYTPAGIGTLGADEYYLTPTVYNSQNLVVRNSYLWKSDIYEGGPPLIAGWASSYAVIYKANVVMDYIKNFDAKTESEKKQKDYIIGQASFIRAYAHFFLEEIYGQPYNENTAAGQLGIPLKTTSDLADKAKRATVAEVFRQNISDLETAVAKLGDEKAPISRPSKAAAYAMLAKIYLTMHNYSKAADYANASLAISGAIYDYNNLTIPATGRTFAPFAAPNDFVEVLYPASQSSVSLINSTTLAVDTNFYASYTDNDLRKSAYFSRNATTKTYSFRGSYWGGGGFVSLYNGPFTDEVLLIRAECYARMGKLNDCLADMDSLLIKRYKKKLYVPFITNDQDEALAFVLRERKKELAFRGLRWIDLRRLNQDPKTQITLTRIFNGITYKLPPNDKRYTFPIPLEEISLSGLNQNER